MCKVSIIIPVYNEEKYLNQCLRSAIEQTLMDIEIICLNDGSTDHSLRILEDFAREDSRIKIIDKVNTGYGNTMNTGIDLAAGKYLVFLESDDFIMPDLCEKLYYLCEKYELDIIKTDFYEFKMKGKEVCSRYKRVSDYDNYHKVLTPVYDTEVFYASMYTWTCMYNRKFINKYHIRHNETQGASYQDNGFWFQTLMYCRRIYLVNQAFYMYRQDNPESSIYSKGKVRAFSDEYKFIRKKINEYGENQSILFAICAFFNLHHNLISLKRVGKEYTEELIRIILNDFEENNKIEAWNIRNLDIEFIKKIMVCKTQPKKLREEIWRYIDKNTARKEFLDIYDTYILYGAGSYANYTFPILEECMEEYKMWTKDILCGVTLLEERGKTINGIEIKEMKELLQYKDKALVIVCAKKESENCNEMCNNLKGWGVKNVIHSNELIAKLTVKDFWDEFLI